MKKHFKKMIAPIVIAVIFLAYLIPYGFMVAAATEFSPFLIFLTIPLIALGVGMVYVLITRLREIRSGEEDDLDKY
ncbi:MAG: hypothetical protein IKE58_13085 [Blautia sp.]|nr:hypothetical protein [Blautia sp.]